MEHPDRHLGTIYHNVIIYELLLFNNFLRKIYKANKHPMKPAEWNGSSSGGCGFGEIYGRQFATRVGGENEWKIRQNKIVKLRIMNYLLKMQIASTVYHLNQQLPPMQWNYGTVTWWLWGRRIYVEVGQWNITRC